MDISGTIQFYDSSVSSPFPRATMASLYYPFYPSTSMAAPHPQMQHNNPSNPYNGADPAFANHIQQLLPPLTGFVEELHSAPPAIKSEAQWNGLGNSPFVSNTKTVATIVNFGTEVDTLMKAIQAKTQTITPQKPSSADQGRPVVGVSRTPPYVQAASQARAYGSGDQEEASPKGGKKEYQCTIENCTKSFYHKTHLDAHERSHTGAKPYPCKELGCGRSFSQLGNLKTHERRHTGERPYHCEICGKGFAQRWNVRAHKIVHDRSKPYLCRLDDCGKQFTQLGNLKSHQNKFHIATIRALTTKFASIKDGDIVHAADKELWEYFANLYKNSNKGIKGRGKDRKVGSNNSSALYPPPIPSLVPELSISSAGRGNMIIGVGAGVMGAYDTGSSGGVSSVQTCDDDLPLAFEERMY